MKSIILTICIVTLAVFSTFGQGYTVTREALPLGVQQKEVQLDPANYRHISPQLSGDQQMYDEERSNRSRLTLPYNTKNL